jgi:hypothetical protein
MNFIKNNKIIFGGGVIATIILGIITNAIWDGIKPITQYLFELILNLSIFGIEKFKDGIYAEIAKGMHEGPSLQVFLTVYSFLLSFIIVVVISTILLRRKMILRENGLNNEKQTTVDKIISFQNNLSKKSSFVWFLVFYTLFVVTIFSLDLVKQKYINSAVTNYEQISKIIRPYISEEQNLQYISNFSQIKNRSDYVNIVDKLKQIAQDNKQSVPDFSFTF